MTGAGAARAVRALTVVLAVSTLAAAAGPLTWHLRGDHATEPPQAIVVPAEMAVRGTTDIGPILALAPFGSVEVDTPERADPVATDLDLVLLGVIVRRDAALSSAQIDGNGVAATYRIGDTVAGHADLTGIEQDHVILDVDGTDQTLYFPGREPDAGSAADVDDRTSRMLAALRSGPDVDRQARDTSQPESTQDYIDLWRDRIRANPGEVLDQIGLVPSENGYIIADDHDTGVALAGLQAGDIVTRVNGQPVGDVDADRQLYDEVAASRLARIEIERGGETIVMSFPLQ